MTLVTGVAGFIGNELALKLVKRGDQVVGIDNLNDYYDVNLKKARLARLVGFDNFRFLKLDIADRKAIKHLFETHQFEVVVNLAAQAGVRYSLENPHAYIDANLVGFANVLEGCRHSNVKHLVFASTSSVYGANTKLPFSETDNVDHPVSLYAATKKANELMAHSYAHLYGLPCTGLRFFTVYGPWGRPDMAYFSFTKKILAGEPIDVFNEGNMQRDFTYIEDIVSGVERVMDSAPVQDSNTQSNHTGSTNGKTPYRIFNIGNSEPVELLRFIQILESLLQKKAKLNMLPMQEGDMQATYANTDALERAVGFKPSTAIEQGLGKFVEWYLGYFE